MLWCIFTFNSILRKTNTKTCRMMLNNKTDKTNIPNIRTLTIFIKMNLCSVMCKDKKESKLCY